MNENYAPQKAGSSDISIPTPNDPPWNSPVAVGMWFFSVLAIIVFPLLFLAPYVAQIREKFAGSADLEAYIQNDPTAVLLRVAAIIPAHVATFLIAWLVVTKNRKYSFRNMLGWSWAGIRWWHYVLLMAGYFAIASVVASYYPEQDNELLQILRSSRAAVFIVAFMGTFTAPIVEEVVYRGIMYSAFQRTFGVIGALCGVTLLFALVHLPQYYPSYSTMFLLVLLSLTLTTIRAWSGSLLPCIILHTIFNGLQSLILILQPYIDTPAIQPDPIPGISLFLK